MPYSPDSGSIKTVRVCSAQIAAVWDSPEKTLQKIEPYIYHAARSGADIICFPEQFTTGWDPESRDYAQDESGQIVSTLQRLAHNASIAILGSFRERSGNGIKNTAIAIGKEGNILTTYSKIHLFSHSHENDYYEPGSSFGLFTIGEIKFGIAICYDLRFPELFRLYEERGAHAVVVPAAWPADRIRHWELFIRARAAENQMYVTGINTTGTTPVDMYSGHSMTADPSGNIIQRCGNAEELGFIDLDPEQVLSARKEFPLLKDRKVDVYRSLSRDEK